AEAHGARGIASRRRRGELPRPSAHSRSNAGRRERLRLATVTHVVTRGAAPDPLQPRGRLLHPRRPRRASRTTDGAHRRRDALTHVAAAFVWRALASARSVNKISLPCRLPSQPRRVPASFGSPSPPIAWPASSRQGTPCVSRRVRADAPAFPTP